MRKVVAAINMTLDGYCDHTAIVPDDEIHQHYADLLKEAGIILYGRITYQLMEYWPTVVATPTGNKATDEFALLMDQIPKLVFSRTIKEITWQSARLSRKDLRDQVLALQQQPGRDILVGSRSLMIQLMQQNLIDEYQFCIHPVVAGGGLPLFENMNDRFSLALQKIKRFAGGAVAMYYTPVN